MDEYSVVVGKELAPAGLARSIGPFMDDALVLVGAVLIGVGVWHYWPGCIWFYAGGWCVVIGILLGVPERRSALAGWGRRPG